MTEASTSRARWLALAWLLLSLVAAGQCYRVFSGGAVTVDLFALLPEQALADWQRQAIAQVAERGNGQLVVVLSSRDPAQLTAAAEAFVTVLQQQMPALQQRQVSAQQLDAALSFYQLYRQQLTDADHFAALQATSTEQVVQSALARLLQPVAMDVLQPWQADPLGLGNAWWGRLAADTGLQLDGAALSLEREGRRWRVLLFELEGPAFALSGERPLGRALDAAQQAATAVAGPIDLLYAGVPLHADAAAAQAAGEMSTIGLGSLLAVLLLVWLAFRSLRPLALVASSLIIGCVVALAATVALFGEVHVLTLVFGASLVGVAEDYGIHYFAARQAEPSQSATQVLRRLRPSLWLALLTSALAYLAIGALPFPGLRQMAVFSAVGLAAAFITVLLWFPLLDTRTPRSTAFADRMRRSLPKLPALPTGAALALAGLILMLSGYPLWRANASDDLRQLQGSPPTLIAMQQQLDALLGLPSPAQFFLLEADNSDQLLQREEALIRSLQPLRQQGLFSGWSALSDTLPSAARQQANLQRIAPLEYAALQAAGSLLGEPAVAADSADGVLSLEQFAASPLAALRPELIYGKSAARHYTAVRLRGLQREALPLLAALHRPEAGVHWLDRTADYSRLLGEYRQRMSWLFGLGLLAVILALAWRFGRSAWRAWLPTVLATSISLSALSLLGQPIYLFNVLALLLLLGIGIDYGIFLLEHGDGAAWMAVALGAVSTLLAFGLLGLSATPALRAFGLTLLFGIGSVWLLSPLYRLPPSTRAPTHAD